MKTELLRVKLVAVILPVLFLAVACEKKESPAPPSKTPVPQANSSGNPLTAPLDYIESAGKAQKSAQKTVETASLNKAVQMFQVQEGRNPKDLNELVTSEIMTALPKPPYGMKFQYDAASGRVQVVPQ